MISSHEFILAILIVAYAAHMLEEYILNWRGWAQQLYGLDVPWELFYMVNAVVIIAGFCATLIGWRVSWVSLMFAALASTDAILLHIVPTLVKRRFSPGLLSGMACLLPGSIWAYVGARSDGVLDAWGLVVSLVGGMVIIVYPFVLIWLKPALAER